MHVKTIENLLSNQFIEDWLPHHARIHLYCCKQKQNLLEFERHRHVDFPIEKFIILTEDVALLTKIFMGMKANLVKFIWCLKYFFNVFPADKIWEIMFFRPTFFIMPDCIVVNLQLQF